MSCAVKTINWRFSRWCVRRLWKNLVNNNKSDRYITFIWLIFSTNLWTNFYLIYFTRISFREPDIRAFSRTYEWYLRCCLRGGRLRLLQPLAVFVPMVIGDSQKIPQLAPCQFPLTSARSRCSSLLIRMNLILPIVSTTFPIVFSTLSLSLFLFFFIFIYLYICIHVRIY